jgi:hypothetical protein
VSSAQTWNHDIEENYLAVRLDAVLQAVKLPAGISDLDSCLADMDTLGGRF